MRVGQLWSWIYARGAGSFEDMSDVSKELRATLARAYCAGAAGDRHRAGVGRRHAQVAAAAAHPRAREARAGDRDGLHPRGRPRHAVHLEPGRLHAHLLVLPHRHAAAGAQPRGRGDRRPDPARPRPHRRLAGRRRRRRTARSLPASGAQDHQRRADGHGRAALQFRQRARCHGRCRRRRRPRHVEAAHHAVDQRRGAADPALGRGGRHHARHLAARGAATSCATSWCRSTASIRLPS